MIAEFGAYCLALGLGLSGFQVFAGFAGARRPLLGQAAQGAALAVVLCLGLSFAALVQAFVTSDFSLANVAANSHARKPLLYRIAGAWGSHEGSMLLWCLVLTGYGALVAVFGRNLPGALRSRVLAIQAVLAVMFLAYTLFASNPFERISPVPVEGRSLNPLLQDPALAFHPPFLYAGYVGFSVVFSFAMAALIEGRVDPVWARWVRPWTLAAWSLLGIGIMLGAYWAYYELGWGGWWFWDPVENASFMPWLAGTALLHSAIVTERRGALAGWTVFLALLGFIFAMLGAFLVRSGVLTSVHAFAVDPERGILLLIMLATVATVAFGLFAWRAPGFARGGAFAPVSRESSLVLNNILLTAATASVLLGTLYPLIREAMDGQAVSVGAPYFDLTFTPLLVLAMLLVPFGPLLAWKRGNPGRLAKGFAGLAVVSLLGAGLAFGLVQPARLLAALSVGLGIWLVGGTLIEFLARLGIGPMAPARAASGSLRQRLAHLPMGAFGMSLAHLGLGLFVIGAGAETAWRIETARVLAPGDSLTLGRYELKLEDVRVVRGPNFEAEQGRVVLTAQNGQPVCSLLPERRMYMPGGQVTSEVGICTRGLDHLYVVLGDRRAAAAGSSGGWLVRAYVNPLVLLILIGPLLMALGGLVSITDRRLRIGIAAPRSGVQAGEGAQ